MVRPTPAARPLRLRRKPRARPVLLLLWLALLFGGWRVGQSLAGRIEMPRALPIEPGMRFVPARDRSATRLRAEVVPERRARKTLGRAPRGYLVAVTMDYPHPDTGEARRGTLAYETGGDLFRRIRPEMGGYAGPAFRAMAAALRPHSRRASARLAAAPRYRLDSDVHLSLRVERRLSSVAEGYHDRTGRDLTVTSGTRDAAAQARAMHTKFVLGDDVVGLYGGGPLVLEIKAAYDAGVAAHKSQAAIRRDMEAAILAQVTRGEYISSHLRAGAVDIRSRGLSPTQKKALAEAASAVPNVRLFEEKIPPHFHMNVREDSPPSR